MSAEFEEEERQTGKALLWKNCLLIRLPGSPAWRFRAAALTNLRAAVRRARKGETVLLCADCAAGTIETAPQTGLQDGRVLLQILPPEDSHHPVSFAHFGDELAPLKIVTAALSKAGCDLEVDIELD